MSRKIHFLSAKNIESLKDYIPFANCLTYIKQKTSVIPYTGNGKEQRFALFQKLGTKNYTKFNRKRPLWDKLIGTVPLIYLNAIGVDMNTLLFCLELDKQNYAKALSIKKEINYFSVRYGPCFYGNVPLPEEFASEPKAIEYVHNYMLNNKLRITNAWISFNDVIDHTFTREVGFVKSAYHHPDLIVDRKYLRTNFCGHRMGEVIVR